MLRMITPVVLLSSFAACGGGGSEYDNNDISAILGPSSNPKNPGGGRMSSRSFVQEGRYAERPSGQHWTSSAGCTYSRTQAPDAAPVWYLVLNPHHVGMPNAHAGCVLTVS